jgi:hypothetical protein
MSAILCEFLCLFVKILLIANVLNHSWGKTIVFMLSNVVFKFHVQVNETLICVDGGLP